MVKSRENDRPKHYRQNPRRRLRESDSVGNPGKVELLRNFREHSGEVLAYSVRQQDMHIFILSETSAVAAYMKVYEANENKDVAREDTTHVFTKDHGTWRLRISRVSHPSPGK